MPVPGDAWGILVTPSASHVPFAGVWLDDNNACDISNRLAFHPLNGSYLPCFQHTRKDFHIQGKQSPHGAAFYNIGESSLSLYPVHAAIELTVYLE